MMWVKLTRAAAGHRDFFRRRRLVGDE